VVTRDLGSNPRQPQAVSVTTHIRPYPRARRMARTPTNARGAATLRSTTRFRIRRCWLRASATGACRALIADA